MYSAASNRRFAACGGRELVARRGHIHLGCLRCIDNLGGRHHTCPRNLSQFRAWVLETKQESASPLRAQGAHTCVGWRDLRLAGELDPKQTVALPKGPKIPICARRLGKRPFVIWCPSRLYCAADELDQASGAERLAVYMRRRISRVNGPTKRLAVGFAALLLAALAALQAGAAVRVAVSPALAIVMRATIGATAERTVLSSEVVVWRAG